MISEEENKILIKIRALLSIDNFNDRTDTLLKEKLGMDRSFVRFNVITMRNLLLSIHTLWHQKGLYYSAYVLGRAMVERYIDGMFILKENTEARCQEFIDAFNHRRTPFSDKDKWGDYSKVSERAKSVGLIELYEKSYRTLCEFAHLRAGSHLVFTIENPQFTKDRPVFLKHVAELYAAFLDEISKRFEIKYPLELQDKISEWINPAS